MKVSNLRDDTNEVFPRLSQFTALREIPSHLNREKEPVGAHQRHFEDRAEIPGERSVLVPRTKV